MGYNAKPIKDKSKVVQIVVVDRASEIAIGEGEYEVRFLDRLKEVEYHDIISLSKLLNKIWSERQADILDILCNFNKVYLNLESGEITS